MMAKSCALVVLFAAALAVLPATLAQSNFDYSRQQIPNPFRRGNRYPNREEKDVCRPIFDHIERNSARFRNELVFNTNRNIAFSTGDARRMSSRMQTRLDRLRQLYTRGFTVLKAWSQYPDSEVQDSGSLHYEGRTIRIRVHQQSQVSEFLTNAVEAAFDWVSYENDDYVRLSVIPDSCENNVDMVFVLDQSGSVGRSNHGLAIQFILNIIQFFSIASDATRVGFVAYSSSSHIEFDLDRYTSANQLTNRIRRIGYRGGQTATALGLNDAAILLNPRNNRGARPASEGIPKVAILITDGKSNQYSLTSAVPNIKRLGVQVYAIGIANPDVNELQFISSDPDAEHVFLLNSYNDAAGFVDFLSVQTCDTPAIIDPGDNTTTDIPEDGIRYFQVECDSFSNTVLVELYDNIGTSFLYCSATEQNPGPLTSNTVVNDTAGINIRTCVVSLTNTNSRVVYIAVQGQEGTNQFTVVVWDLLLTPDRDEIVVLEGQTGVVYDVSRNRNSGAAGTTFRYYITEGNTGNNFNINNNGRVSVSSRGLDFDADSFYSLLIVAENRRKSCQRSRFRLDVRVGRNEIIFPTLTPVPVSETASVGTEVTTIQATGGAGRIEYSITSSNVPFTIGQTTGTLVVNGILNFEDEMQYNVVVEAESVGTTVSGSATQVVNIVDINEQPEWETSCARAGNCAEVVTENQGTQNVGRRLEVSDPDLPSLPNGQIDYSIQSSETQLPFSINSNGQVRITGSLDRETKEMYTFTVTAADRGNPSLSVSTTYRVTVKDENDEAPVFTQGLAELTIPENEPVDTIIEQYMTTDADTPPNSQVTYTLSPSLGIPFTLDANNGALSITEIIDYEDPDSREFSVTVTANNPPLSSTVMTRIIVTDVNDNAPIFQSDSYTVSVLEHSIVSTTVETVIATDADSGSNGEIRYAITSGNSQGFFSISPIGGVIKVANEIDREQIGSVELRVRARDRGSPRLSDFATVTVTIADINDHPPVFDPDTYTTSLREDASVNTVAFTVFATDADEPGNPNSIIVYSIEQGNVGGAFDIDSNSGAVTIASALNHEAISSYSLTIRAVDQGNPHMSATATADVTVINVNEAPPTLSGDQTVDISEATPTGVLVASFSASDPDFMPVSITIDSGNTEGKFSITSEGVISLAENLDFETTQIYVLRILADDGDATDEALLTVNVLDENEFAPEFNGPTSFSVDEELPASTVVGTVSATDGDGSAPNNEITFFFSMQNSIQDYFLLDSSSGEITTAAVLDREVLTDIFPVPSSSLSVRVFARDGGSPSRQSSITITITLQDINDNDPEFADDEYTNSIFENQPAQIVLMFSAIDVDLGSNADITFSYTVDPPSGLNLFQLTDGEISTTGPLDCEAQTQYNFIITATDHGTPARSANVPGTLLLRDQNDNAPVFLESPYTFEVDENAPPIQTIVGQVIANDADKGTNGEVFYEILGQDDIEEESESVGNVITFFEIDPDTGDIRHVTPFDFESFLQVMVTVRANDRGTPRRFSTVEVVFNVRNVDEVAPRFSSSCADVTLSENTPVNSVIVDCMASDLDNTTTPDDSDWITYTIESGNTDNAFSIGLNTGVIVNEVELDYEAVDFYRLSIRAIDGSGRSRSRRVDIDLIDENDNAPVFESSSFSFAMTSERIEANTQMVARVSASDSDTGINGEVSYSIEENGIEQVSETETRVTVTARDGADTPQVSTAALTIRFDEECLLQKYTVNPMTGDVRADVLCSIEIQAENADVLMGNDHIAYCRIVRNTPARYQWLLNGSAIDLTQALPDEDQQAILSVDRVGFQDAGTYACKVTTEAGSLQTSTYALNILVVPSITTPPQSSAVQEGRDVEFRCFAVGIPSPDIRWEYQEMVVATGNTLTIAKVDAEDHGEYYCVAVSSAGNSSAIARLAVFKEDDLAQILVKNVGQPSSDGTCHYMDPESIQNALTELSGELTMITGILGENLCEINSCSPNPCGNGGSCQMDDNVQGGYVCTCPDGYTGVNCLNDIDECQEDPCGSTGDCTNMPGLYQCTCSGSTGNRCQYPDSCISTSCSDGQLCIESLVALNGYFCAVIFDRSMILEVTGVEVDLGFLDDLLVNYREALLQQQAANNRRRRSSNESLTIFASSFCNPRFKQLEPADNGGGSSDGDRYGLFWDCPAGESVPPDDIQAVLCEALVQSGLVASCKAANMSVVTPPTRPPSLPEISVTIDVIQVDSSGEPLSVGQTLSNLLEVIEQLDKSGVLAGADVDSVSAVVPIVCTSECINGECTDRDTCTCNDGWTGETCDKEQQGKREKDKSSTGVIVGVVVAVLVAAAIALAVAAVVYFAVRKNKDNKTREELTERYAKEMGVMEPTQSDTKTSPTPCPAPCTTSEKLTHVENSDYDQLPALKPSAVTLAGYGDYDQLPALKPSAVPLAGYGDYDQLPARNTSSHKGNNTGK